MDRSDPPLMQPAALRDGTVLTHPCDASVGCRRAGAVPAAVRAACGPRPELGISRFIAETFAYNGRMLAVLQHCGLPLSMTTSSGIIQVTIEIDGDRISRRT